METFCKPLTVLFLCYSQFSDKWPSNLTNLLYKVYKVTPVRDHVTRDEPIHFITALLNCAAVSIYQFRIINTGYSLPINDK